MSTEEQDAHQEPDVVDPFRRFQFRAIVAVVIVIAAAAAAKPAYKQLKIVRGRSHARSVERQLNSGRPDFSDAMRNTRLGLRLAPHDPVVLRAAARFTTRIGSDEGLKYWQLYLDLQKPSRPERIEFIESAIRMNWLEAAMNEVNAALRESPKDLELVLLRVRVAGRQMNRPLAEQLAREATRQFPLETAPRALLGEILLSGTNETSRLNARRLLWPMALETSPFQDHACELLASVTNLNSGEAAVLVQEFRRQTNSLRHDLWATNIEFNHQPGDRPGIIRRLVERQRGRTSAEDISQVVSWLTLRGQTEAALEVLNQPATASNSVLASLRLETLARSGRWKELAPLLEDTTSVADPSHRFALRGMLAAREGRPDDSDKEFQVALKQAGSAPQRLLLIARHAELAGRTNAALQAWFGVASYPPQGVIAAANILRIQRTINDPKILHRTLERLARMVPSDPTIVGRFAYYGLLLDDHVDIHYKQLKQLAETSPSNRDLRVSLALAEMKRGDANAALLQFEQEGINTTELEDRERAVYIAALGMNQQREAARVAGRSLRLDKLNDKERDLVKPWL